MKYFFTSDLHFSHFNIIKYCNRPFNSVEEMNNKLIQNWNNRVKPEDTVFHIGDFCFKNSSGGKFGEGLIIQANNYISKLNGNIVFLQGNHDHNNSLKAIIQNLVIRHCGYRWYLVHDYINAPKNEKLVLCGHVHGAWEYKYHSTDNRLFINVGVDVNNFMPVTLEEIISKHSKQINLLNNLTRLD